MLATPINSEAQGEPEWVIDAQAAQYFSENSQEQESLLGVEVFLRRTFGDQGYGLYAFGYHDEQFWEVFFGLSKIFGNLEIGLGAGQASYGGKRWFDINPWLFYSDGVWEGSLHLEYIAEESNSSEWFYKYHLQRSFGSRWFAGLYGEKTLGMGPMAGIEIGDHLSLWTSVPVLDKPDYGAMSWMLALSMTFE